MDNGENPDQPKLSTKEQLLVEFGRSCSSDSCNIDDKMFDALRIFFNDAQIVLLTSFAGLMIATNLMNNALQVDLDQYLENYTRR